MFQKYYNYILFCLKIAVYTLKINKTLQKKRLILLFSLIRSYLQSTVELLRLGGYLCYHRESTLIEFYLILGLAVKLHTHA